MLFSVFLNSPRWDHAVPDRGAEGVGERRPGDRRGGALDDDPEGGPERHRLTSSFRDPKFLPARRCGGKRRWRLDLAVLSLSLHENR